MRSVCPLRCWKIKTYTGTSPPLFSKKAMPWGKKMAGTNEFAFFRCKSICTGGGPESGRKKFEKCLPAGTGGGYLGFFLGGGVPILFLWARGFFWTIEAQKPTQNPKYEEALRRPRMSGRRMSGTSRRFPRHFLNCDFPEEIKERQKNLNSQTWPGTARRPSPRHLQPSELLP